MSEVVYRNLIDGEWVAGPGAVENVNPSDVSDVLGVCQHAGASHVTAAVEAANRAFPAWRDASPQVRAELLDQVGQALHVRRAEIGRLLAREEGKTLAEATAEVVRASQIFKFFAGEALRMTGEAIASVRPGVDVEVLREPVGVVALITPWNFPIAIPAWKIAPALAFGNTVVVKPAELTPACLDVLASILLEAGCPRGVFNLLHGAGPIVGRGLVEHPDVAAVSFTGSAAVGRQVAAAAVQGMKRVQLEMGGKNPMVVMADCELDAAVAVCVNGAFYSTGQRCTASSRLIVEDAVHDAFVERMLAATAGLRVGDALDPATVIGPVASQAQLDRVEGYVQVARQEGCDVVGGRRLGEGEGYFLGPALFLDATNRMRISQEEVFGPAAAVLRVSGFDEAISVANDTTYGLAAGICTTNLSHAREFRRRSNAGMVMVNLPTAGVDYHVPFGGRRGSSYGPREQGQHAREFYTSTKTTYLS